MTMMICLLALLPLLVSGGQMSATGEAGDLRWNDIVWVSLPIGDRTVAKAVLALNVEIVGLNRKALMQLDLGSDSTVIKGVPYRALGGLNTPEGGYIEVTGIIADYPFKKQAFFLATNSGDPPKEGETPELGTIGANFFQQRLLVLDLVRNKVAIASSINNIPRELEEKISFGPLQYRRGKIFIDVHINGHEEKGIFYDTGASSFSIVTMRERWEQLTGRMPTDDRNDVWSLSSWGKKASLIGAPLRGSMCISNACLEAPMVYFESSGLKNFQFDKYPFPATGLVGNAPFVDRYSIVIDLPNRRFGLYRGSLAGAK